MVDTDTTPPTSATARPRPQSLADLFWSFTKLALQGFGGVVAIVQRELVDKKQWLTREEFVEDWAVAQIMPGPNVVNLSLMIGDRYFGWRGGLVALAGMLTFPLLILLVVTALFGGMSELPQSQNALRGMGAVAAGMIMAAGLRLAPTLMSNSMGASVSIALAATTLIATAWLRVPLLYVLLGLGGLACLWCYRCLGRIDARKETAQ
ncbi:MAG: chromate transporter [Rhodoferax sp.]|nr:MAG: chromate transporter [Rhodoferax sp.]